MKINSVYIASFGKIKNLKLDFNDGFNIIYGNNEDGKTTVMAFIKMMFYGSERGGNSISKNIRKKYTPWDSSTMAGSIDFEHGGKTYRLEKEFRTSNSTDKATLYDLKLSEKVTVSGDIGAKFFGLSLSAFERSVFIGQFGFPENDSDAEGEISSKLSNLALTGDENVSFEAVNARLQKAKLSLMSKSGRAGEYDKNIKLLSDTEEQIRTLTLASEEYSRKKEEAQILKTEIESLQTKAEALKLKISAEQDIRNAEKLRKLLSLKGELDSLNQTLTLSDGSVIDEMYLRKLKFCLSKTETLNQKISAKNSEIELLNKSISTGKSPSENESLELNALLDEKIKEYEGLKQKIEQKTAALKNSKAKKCNKPLLFSGIAVSLIGFICAVVLHFWGVIGTGLGLIVLILSFIIKPSQKKLIKEIDALKTSLYSAGLEKDNISVKIDALNTTSAVVENQQNLLENSKAELEVLKANLKEETKTLYNLASLYKKCETTDEVDSILSSISQITEKQGKIKTELSVYLKELDGISYESAKEKLQNLSQSDNEITEDFEEIKKHFSEIMSVIADKNSQYATVVTESKTLKNASENLEVLRKKRDDLKEKVSRQKEFCDIIDLASVTLAESFAEVHSSYGAVLEQKAAEIFENLTLGKYKDMYISKSFDIDVGEKDAFGRREIGFLSSGAADQGYLSLRLALSNLMSEANETLPILLDDSLAQYDDKRTDSAIAFLKEYSENQQVIMFTCHSHICEKAKTLGITSLSLTK